MQKLFYKFIFSIFFIFAFIVFLKAQVKEPYYRPTQKEVMKAKDFAVLEEIKKVKNCVGTIKNCGFKAMSAHGIDGFGGPEEIHFFENQFQYQKAGKTIGVFLFSILPREEKITGDERTRVEFVREGKAWKFVTIGTQTRCVNGKRITKWSKIPCR